MMKKLFFAIALLCLSMSNTPLTAVIHHNNIMDITSYYGN